jgi:ferredoxin
MNNIFPIHAPGLLNIISLIAGLIIFFSMLVVFILSLKEREPRAAKISLLITIWVPALYFFIGFSEFRYHDIIAVALLGSAVLFSVVMLFPANRDLKSLDDTPRGRIDERDTMFSRYYTPAESEHLADYYRQNPDKKVLDDKFRVKPGLLNKGSKYYDPVLFAAADASFKTVTTFHDIIDDGPVGENRVELSPAAITGFIKNWAVKLGAVSAGVTELKDYHLYSIMGRGKRYGKPVELSHKYAIAVTVEMDKHMLAAAPLGPAIMESSQQYMNCGSIASQIAEMIHNLGYAARAHIDGNYRVVCPLVARDAGLGEIGRMGLLMTPQLGPRVRIAVITTDLPLVCDERNADVTVIDFCTKCNKCALACPSKAIPFGNMEPVDGVRRWQINSEACFTIWCAFGTDCGRCVSVCPYSHPDNIMHNFVRRGVRSSKLFRRFAIKMDDVFYGKNPAPAAPPAWIPLRYDAKNEPGVEDHIVRH